MSEFEKAMKAKLDAQVQANVSARQVRAGKLVKLMVETHGGLKAAAQRMAENILDLDRERTQLQGELAELSKKSIPSGL